MVTVELRPIESEIGVLREYLRVMEHLLQFEEHEEHTRQKEELERTANTLRQEIQEERDRFERRTPTEKEAANLEALHRWEDSWMVDGLFPYEYRDSTDDGYYTSPEYELTLTEGYLEALEDAELLFDFKYVLRSSFFAHAYAFVETRLNRVCDWVMESHDVAFSVKDLRPQGFDHLKKYLLRTVGVDLAEVPAWTHLTAYRKLRNCVMHSRGILTSSNDDQYLRDHYIPQERACLGVDKDDRVIFGEEFGKSVLDNIEIFFGTLDREMSKIASQKRKRLDPNS